MDLRRRLSGDNVRDNFGDPGPVSISRRINVASTGNLFSLHGPTATHRESAAIAERALAKVERELATLIEQDLRALERKLEAAGVPWTPGRVVP